MKSVETMLLEAWQIQNQSAIHLVKNSPQCCVYISSEEDVGEGGGARVAATYCSCAIVIVCV